MTTTFKKMCWLGGIAITVIAGFIGMQISAKNPLRKPESDIKFWILKEVPLGSSVDQVKAFIKSQGWKLDSEWHGNPGTVSSETAYPSAKNFPGVLGGYFIGADLGEYQGIPWQISVDAYWGFDSEKKLIDLRVRKMSRAL